LGWFGTVIVSPILPATASHQQRISALTPISIGYKSTLPSAKFVMTTLIGLTTTIDRLHQHQHTSKQTRSVSQRCDEDEHSADEDKEVDQN
jgi:hypothetical protein